MTAEAGLQGTLLPEVTQKRDTFNSCYLWAFSQYFNVTIKYWSFHRPQCHQIKTISFISEQPLSTPDSDLTGCARG